MRANLNTKPTADAAILNDRAVYIGEIERDALLA
jgi:hypothetical protein